MPRGSATIPNTTSTRLRLGYESMVTPGTVYDYDVATGALTDAEGAGDPVGL